jgi:hypothetical protein
MLAQIITENGQKKIKPLTADAGAGNPVGTIIVVCSNQIPSNYLPLGTQYDTSLYPVLYALLGTDTTPTASALGLPTLSSGQYAIKATSGLTENQQENVLNTINDNLSYSTTEHKTGKKWIDGKPIYSKVIIESSVKGTQKDVDISALSIDTCMKLEGTCLGTRHIAPINTYRNDITVMALISTDSSVLNLFADGVLIDSTAVWKVTLEYTKTTD